MHFLKQLLAVAAIAVSTLAGAEPGVTATTITLGMSSPFTGPNGAYGLDMRQVIESYFDQVNKSGGVNGRKVSLLALDDGYETERTVANTNALINDKKVFALLAGQGAAGGNHIRCWLAARADFAEPGQPLHVQCSGQLCR